MKNNSDNVDFMAEVEELQEKITSLQQRIKLVEKNKDKVRPKIYQKVKSDYESKLTALFQELEPFKEKIETQISSLESEIETQSAERDSLEEELEELQLRFLAGEFSEDDFTPQKEELTEKMTACEKIIHEKKDEIRTLRSKLAFISGEEEPLDEEKALEEDEGVKDEEAAPGEMMAQQMEEVESKSPPEEESVEQEIEELEDFEEKPEEEQEALSGAYEEENAFGEPMEEMEEEYASPLIDETAGGNSELVNEMMVEEEKEQDLESDEYIWTTTPVLDVIEGDFAGESYPMDKERITIGRGPNNDIQLATDTSVSRYHAQLTFENNRYVLVDLESSNGTSVNGIRITRTYLRPNDEIMIGQSKLIIRPSED